MVNAHDQLTAAKRIIELAVQHYEALAEELLAQNKIDLLQKAAEDNMVESMWIALDDGPN